VDAPWELFPTEQGNPGKKSRLMIEEMALKKLFVPFRE